MAQQVATSKTTSSFTAAVNHVLPNLSAWSFPTTRCPVPTVYTSLSAAQGLARAPNAHSDNNATVPQMVPVTSGGTVYYLNPSSRPNFVVVIPSNVSLAAPVTARGPEVVPTVSIATPCTEATAFTVQDLAQLLASSQKNHIPERKPAQYDGDPVRWQE